MTSLFLLNIDQEVVKIVPSKDILELWQDMGINEVDTINATLILSKELVTDMEEVFYVGISDIEDKHAFNLYKIITKETTMTEIRLRGIQLAFDELEGKGYIKDLRPNNEPFSSILTRLLEGTDWSLGYVDSNIPNVTARLYYLNRLDSIAEIINVTGAELKFKVAISDNQITDKYVEAYMQIGKDTGKRFVYGTNTLEIVAEEDIGGIYTSAVGRGRGEEISSAEDNPSGQAGYGRKITFEDVEWKKSDGHPVDKPLGQEWIEIPEATEMFGYPDGSARNKLLEFPNETDPEQLIWATYHELLELSRPKVQFKTKVENIGLSHYGDTVTIVRYDIDLKYQARIFKVRYNRLNMGASELDIGDVVLESSTKKQARFRKEVSRDLEQVNRDIENTHIIASDGTRVNHGAEEPTTKKLNDVWFETLNDGTTRIRVWDGNQWVIEIDTSDTTKNADAIREQQKEIEEARQVADDAVNEINTAVENAGFTSLDDTINNISGIASGVKSELDIAIENAGFTSLDDTLQNMKNITMNADEYSQQAITDASNAYSLAQTSISEAQTAQENSLTALGKSDDALEGVSNLDVRVDDVEAELELKADNTFMTEDGELITLSNAITFNAHRFSSDMSRIESRVESLAGEINLVILKDSFKNRYLLDGDTYPNPSVTTGSTDTMREMIDVTPGEQFALSKNTVSGNNNWRINFYDSDGNFIVRSGPSPNEFILTVPDGAVKMWVSYPREANPQIVRGTEFIPYRPNMADQMTTNEMVIFRNEYDEFADETQRRMSAIDESGGRLEVAENLITQTANGLSLKADQTTVNKLTGDIENLGAQIDVTSGQISTKVWNTDIESAIDGIEVGGRNLIRRQNEIENMIIGPDGENLFSYGNIRAYYAVPIETGKTYMFSRGVSETTDPRFRIAEYRNDGSFRRRIAFADETYKYEPPEPVAYIRISYPNDTNVKMELGNVATDWTPAPEDTDAKISHVESSLDIEAGRINALNSRVGSTETFINELTLTPEGFWVRTARLDIATQRIEAIATLEQTVEGLQSTVADKASQSQVTQLATGVSTLVTNVSQLEEDGRNLIRRNDEVKNVLIDGSGNDLYDNRHNKSYYSIHVESGKSYMFSQSGSKHADPRIRIAEYRSNNSFRARLTSASATYLYKPEEAVAYIQVSYPNDANIKMELGDKATPYSPAPEDTATTSQISQIESSLDIEAGRINALNTRVGSTETFINDLTLTPEGFWVRTARLDTATQRLEAITTLEQTVEGLQSQVYSADGSSMITQLATGVSSLVTNVSQLEEDGRNLLRRENELKNVQIGPDGDDLASYRDNKARYAVQVESGRTYTFSRSTSGHSTSYIRIAEYRSNGSFRARFTTTSETYKYVPAEAVSYIRISYPNDVDIKMELGSKATPYSPAPEDTATTSQISQLSDNINLRVTKGELLSQINIEAGRTLIHTDKLLLKAENVVFSGTAWIPNSVIGNLSADKITSGKLDAGKITVVNLDANSITSNKASFVTAGFNAINSNLTISGSALTYSHTDGSQTIMNANGMYHRRGGTNYETHFFHDVITVNDLNHASTGKWVTLPSIYKGKNFTAHAVVSDTYGVTNDNAYYNLAMLRVVCFVDQIDKAGGRVRVRGYSFHRDLRNNNTMRKAIQAKVIVKY